MLLFEPDYSRATTMMAAAAAMFNCPVGRAAAAPVKVLRGAAEVVEVEVAQVDGLGDTVVVGTGEGVTEDEVQSCQ